MTEERLARIEKVARNRQLDFTVVLENVHDPHNVGAVLRTCDSVGINEIYILNNNAELVKNQVVIGKSTSSGARKWLDIHAFNDTEKCFAAIRQKYKFILGTHLGKEAESLYQLDLTEPTALVFGNEHVGITPESLKHMDGNFIIPQVGMVQSLNISVACAVTLYEAFRQREQKGFYEKESLDQPAYLEIKNKLINRHESRYKGRSHELK